MVLVLTRRFQSETEADVDVGGVESSETQHSSVTRCSDVGGVESSETQHSSVTRCRLGGVEGRNPTFDRLLLDAEARSRPRQHVKLESGEPCYMRLPRGTILHSGDYLQSENGEKCVRVVAKPEAVITVTATNINALLKAAYHLGNRHVPLEITVDYLRLSPDPVLENMLKQMGLKVSPEVTPFFPETGAYSNMI